MNTARAIYRTRVSKFLMPLLGVLFVFSISIHSHRISFSPDSLVQISGASQGEGHSFEGCSACLLHGNIKLTDPQTVFSLIDTGQSISFNETEHSIPYPLLILNKPSRSPPAI
jgi:hypothetical protein